MYDFAVIGGGIVGASTAWQLQQRHPGSRIVLLEKENQFATHQTGHNSGVIHAGIYYEPGSLKARFCKAGVEATIEFCEAHDIPYEQCGKLLVATDNVEQERMLALFERAKVNDLDVELVDAASLRRLEPNVSGIGAILVKTTGIVDYAQVTHRMIEEFRADGGEALPNSHVTALVEDNDSIAISLSQNDSIETRFLVACAGLMADRVARMSGIDIDFEVIPYRGEYYRLPASKNDIVNHLIYPIPDPALPFLGVHLTRMIDGAVTVGPNAVQGWKREGYGKLDVSIRDVIEMLRFPGFWRASRKNLLIGIKETWNSWYKPGYLEQVRKYCPSIGLADLGHYPAGIRAMAVKRDGTMVDDFLFAETGRSLHVCNAPSPAATSAIPIGAYLCDRIDEYHS